MTTSIEKIAIQLADETLKRTDETGNERLYYEVAKVVGSSSQTLEEAFLTEMRIRLAAKKGFDFLTAQKSAQNNGG
jgi:hypothetical protein